MRHTIFLLKVFVIVLAVVWASYSPGHLILDWDDYVVKISLRAFLGVGLSLLFVAMALYAGYKNLYNAVKRRTERKSLSNFKDLQAQVVKGMVDLELGQEESSKRLFQQAATRKAQDDLLVLGAYRAAIQSRDQETLELLVPRLQESSALKGLSLKYQVLREISKKNYFLAYNLSRDALLKATQPWFLKAGVFLAMQQEKFDQALVYVQEGRQLKVFSRGYAQYLTSLIFYRKAMLAGKDNKMYMTHLIKAHELNVGFVDASLALSQAYVREGEFVKTKKILMETWQVDASSYEVAAAYCSLGADPLESAKLARALLKAAPHSMVAKVLLILQYIDAELWGEAKKALDTLVQKKHVEPSLFMESLESLLVYQEKGEAEKLKEALQAWLSAGLVQKWKCQYCGHEATSWQLFCEACDAFDHLIVADPFEAPFENPVIPVVLPS